MYLCIVGGASGLSWSFAEPLQLSLEARAHRSSGFEATAALVVDTHLRTKASVRVFVRSLKRLTWALHHAPLVQASLGVP